jgi:hypothetical protein
MAMNQLLLGAIAMAAITAGLFFFRFWRSTHDRFFLLFALSFWLQGLDRILIGLAQVQKEDSPEFYFVRLIAYSLILVAIYDKNRPRRPS